MPHTYMQHKPMSCTVHPCHACPSQAQYGNSNMPPAAAIVQYTNTTNTDFLCVDSDMPIQLHIRVGISLNMYGATPSVANDRMAKYTNCCFIT